MADEDYPALARLAVGRRRHARGDFVTHEEDRPSELFLLLKGWTSSSIVFKNGARPLLKVHLPGDMIGLPALALVQGAESMVALTDVELAVISREKLGALFEESPRLAAILFLISQEERVAAMDRLATISATEAPQRLAALLVDIHARLKRSDPTTESVFDVPLTQDDVAALIGISPAHLSRILPVFRKSGLITWTRRRITILDHRALLSLAGLPLRKIDQDVEWLPQR